MNAQKPMLDSKGKYVPEVVEKLNDCLTAPKTYLNPFLNNIKIPSIPPLLINREIV